MGVQIHGERKFLRAFICLALMLALLLGTVGAQAAETLGDHS